MARTALLVGEAAGPAVHALVIGVGRYGAPTLPALAQAAPSALAVADWIATRHRRPGLGFGSLDLLASQPSGEPVSFTDRRAPGAPVDHVLDAPSTQNVADAITAWHARVAQDPGNLAVFYFCGHGLELGGLQSLVLEDVDLTAADPFANAIAFNDFLRGMDSCGARDQLFVVDACRDLPLGAATWDDSTGLGRPMVRFNFKLRATMKPRRYVVLEAAAATQKAWSGDRYGWFTQSLLSVLDGAAGDNRFSEDPNAYPVSTRDIAECIGYLVRNQFLPSPAGSQTPVRTGEGDFDVHLPNPPIVPVVVTRRPPETNVGASFEALREGDGAPVATHDCADDAPWQSQLAIGDYVFRHKGDTVKVLVGVPAKRVELP